MQLAPAACPASALTMKALGGFFLGPDGSSWKTHLKGARGRHSVLHVLHAATFGRRHAATTP